MYISGFRSVKVQTETSLKKDSQDFKNSFYLGFLWFTCKPEMQNWKVPFFGVHNCKKPVWFIHKWIRENSIHYFLILLTRKLWHPHLFHWNGLNSKMFVKFFFIFLYISNFLTKLKIKICLFHRVLSLFFVIWNEDQKEK